MPESTDPTKFEVLEIIDSKLIIKGYKCQMGIDVSKFISGYVEYREDVESKIKYFFPAICGDEDFYLQLQKFDWYYQPKKSEYVFASEFTRGKTILDIGCGSGKFSEVASAASYTGLELNKKAAGEGKAQGLNILNEGLEQFSKNNAGQFDVVCLFQVVEHVSDPVGFLRLANDCIRPGGVLIISVPSEDSFVGNATNSLLNMPPHHLSRWTDLALKALAKTLNMQLVKLRHEPLEPIHFDWYVRVRAREALNSILGRDDRQLLKSRTLSELVIGFSAAALGRLFKRKFLANPKEILGHSVTLVLRKPE